MCVCVCVVAHERNNHSLIGNGLDEPSSNPGRGSAFSHFANAIGIASIIFPLLGRLSFQALVGHQSKR